MRICALVWDAFRGAFLKRSDILPRCIRFGAAFRSLALVRKVTNRTRAKKSPGGTEAGQTSVANKCRSGAPKRGNALLMKPQAAAPDPTSVNSAATHAGHSHYCASPRSFSKWPGVSRPRRCDEWHRPGTRCLCDRRGFLPRWSHSMSPCDLRALHSSFSARRRSLPSARCVRWRKGCGALANFTWGATLRFQDIRHVNRALFDQLFSRPLGSIGYSLRPA